MKTKPILLLLLPALLFFTACTRLPVESVSLMDSIGKEGERMHKLNLALLNNLLQNKRSALNEHVKAFEQRYTDNLLALAKKANPSLNMNDPEELKGFFTASRSYVNKYQDSLQNGLLVAYQQYTEKLNSDYLQYQQACNSIKALLSSATRLNKTKEQMLQQVLQLSGVKTDVKKLEQLLDKYIMEGSNASEKLQLLYAELSSLFNK